MRIGLIVGLHAVDAASPAPSWTEIEAQVISAEKAGFDLVVFEDAMYFESQGMWESMSMAGAMAATTDSIGLSHSVVNAPLRHPALIAKAAVTLDEISDGRYTLGIGAGNTPDDYEAFSIDADPRYSRFAEAMAIVHGLMKTGAVDYSGEYYAARETNLYPQGPRPTGPDIVVAASGPKMLQLCAQYGDGWNWFTAATGDPEGVAELLERLEHACEETDRDPASVSRTLDVYSLDSLGISREDRPEFVLTGSAEEMAEKLLSYASLGIDEVRVDALSPHGRRDEAAGALAKVVGIVQRG